MLNLHLLIGLSLLTTCLTPSGMAYGQTGDNALRPYAVEVKTAGGGGSGIYLGNGLVVTAAHVSGHAVGAKVTVHFGDLSLPGTIKQGDQEADLAVLSVDTGGLPANIRSLHLALCKEPPLPQEAVVVVTPGATARSRMMSAQQLPPDLRKFSTVISNVAGNSGSGVFDARNKCLLGIIIARLVTRSYIGPTVVEKDLAKYFVPAWTIENFIPSESRF
jgi:hypothetical protein